MDCQKLDEIAIDLVYGEDAGGEAEVRGASEASDAMDGRMRADAEEHVLGCTRCRALVDRLRAGKKAADSLALETPPSLLESRVVDAAIRASKQRARAPWPRRFARAISTAGAYAMRPQVAMAAVVVVMVGMSVVLLRGGALTARRTKVTEEGTPVASVEQSKDDQGALATIADEDKPKKKEGVAIAGGAMPSAPPAPPAEAHEEKNADEPSSDGEKLAGGGELEKKAKAKSDKDLTGASGALAENAPADGKGGAAAGPGAAAQAAPPPAPAPTTVATATSAPNTNGASTKSAADPSSPTYDAAMDAYVKGKWADAAKGFDAAAAAGTRPSSSTLYAARSLRALGSCGQALPRFQKILSTWPSSPEVPWAALEGGECARALGDDALARTLLEKAKTYPATKARAESNLASMQGPNAGAKPPASYAAPKKAKPSPPSVDDSY